MISRLRGRLLSAQPTCVVDVGGVGFELAITEKDREALSPTDDDVLFYTYLYVREDRLSLFGFLHRDDRGLFLKLIDVTGVGPKLALGMMSLHPAAQIVAAIRRGDVSFLKSLPGLGKKTAERLVMELGEKLDDLTGVEAGTVESASVRDEVILALTTLGMTRHAAENALDKMKWKPEPDGTTNVEAVVKEALKYAGSV